MLILNTIIIIIYQRPRQQQVEQLQTKSKLCKMLLQQDTTFQNTDSKNSLFSHCSTKSRYGHEGAAFSQLTALSQANAQRVPGQQLF